jgi:hypothetical protein
VSRAHPTAFGLHAPGQRDERADGTKIDVGDGSEVENDAGRTQLHESIRDLADPLDFGKPDGAVQSEDRVAAVVNE